MTSETIHVLRTADAPNRKSWWGASCPGCQKGTLYWFAHRGLDDQSRTLLGCYYDPMIPEKPDGCGYIAREVIR